MMYILFHFKIHMADLIALIKSNQDLSLILEALVETGLSDQLSNKEKFTVFAPTDEAFKKALAALDISKDDFFADKLRLESILKFHVIPNEVVYSKNVKEEMVVKTLNDSQELELSGENDNFTVNGTNVHLRDLVADNGVLHIIDRVLLPNLTTN